MAFVAVAGVDGGYYPVLGFYCVLSLAFFVFFLYLIVTKPHLIQETKKYADSPLSGPERDRLAGKIDAYMESVRPYKNPDLSLIGFAKGLGLSPKKVSQILSEAYGTNFYRFINRYRVRDSMALLESRGSRGRTILEILYSVGFNSKSTFNAAFKEIAGVSPREYRQNRMR
jgi:AraC-like DNA-binding protein